MKTALFVATAAASVVASADAGFAGFVAFSRNVGANTVIDVFAAVDNAGDKFLNVYNTTSNGVFVQKAGLASKTWKPDAANFTSTRNVSDDSFMTAGTFGGGAYGGEYYASGNTTADPNFTGTSWNATPASAAATTIPALAGWYTGDPPSGDNNAELMSSWAGGFARTDSTFGTSTTVSGSGVSNSAVYGIWCAHLVVAGNNKVIGVDFGFQAFASIKDVGGAVSQRGSAFPVPAPGAIALVGLAGLAAGRRRRA
jgi:MYXO-CTERM domain-containing protein